MEMTEQQIAALMAQIDARVDARVDSQIASKVGSIENITPIAFEQKYMKGYTNTWPIDQALFRTFLRTLTMSDLANKFFKTIGGVAATQGDDTLTLSGTNGISISANGKTITFNGNTLKSSIYKLYEYENDDVTTSRVKDLAKKFDGTSAEGRYFFDLIANVMGDQERVDYYNALLSVCQTEYQQYQMFTVPFTEHLLCNIYPRVATSTQTGISHYAVVNVVGKDVYVFLKEHYTSINPLTVDMVKCDSDSYYNLGIIMYSVMQLSTDVNGHMQILVDHENRIQALEGN